MRTLLSIFSFLILATSFAQNTGSKLEISHLSGDFYIFTTYDYYKGQRIPANGMYLVTHAGVVLFDSPWDTTQYQPLLDSIKIRHNKKAVLCIATHFHEDRTGGLQYFRQQDIKTYTTRQTDELSKKNGMKRAEFLMDKDTMFTIGQYSFQTYYPGHGHTPDNIVIWFEKEKVLYAGCVIKSFKAKDLGNLKDASVKDYATTVENIQKKCTKPTYVIPGHDDWTSTESLPHTLRLARQLK